MPPSRTAAPNDRPSPQTPSAVTAPTVSSIDTVARRTGPTHRRSRTGPPNGARSLSPAVNSETITATSVMRSSSLGWSTGSTGANDTPAGSMA
jgi:hypothetical protein